MASKRRWIKSVNIADDLASDIINDWLQEDDLLGEDEEIGDGGGYAAECIREPHSDDEDADYIVSDHDTDSECSETEEQDSNLDNLPSSSGNYFYGKNRFKWSTTPPSRNVRTASHNILRLPSRPSSSVQNVNPLEAFEFFFDSNMLDTIITWTNKKLEQLRERHPSSSKHFRETSQIEIKGFIALLLYTSVFKSSRESVLSLFATDGTGREIIRATMSKHRFCALLVALRFDNFEDREQRIKEDPGCAISYLLSMFVTNSQAKYTLGTNVTIDEMLIKFRGRSRFKVYMPSKPGKYGLKMQLMVDSETFFTYNLYLYTGKGSDGYSLSEEDRKRPVPTQAVLRLCEPIIASNRNITTDNWYSSIDLATLLKTKGLTTVGTLRKNKTEIPKPFLPNKNRDVDHSIFGFTKDITLVSYVPKKNRAVILYSSMHHDNTVNEASKKPEIIEFYNNTKGGVDSVDQKCSVYTCSRRTSRWPMAVFYRIVDLSGVNAYIIYSQQSNVKNLTRLNFLKAVAEDLNFINLKTRLYNTTMPREIRTLISRVTKIDMPDQPSTSQTDDILPRNQRKYCYTCNYKKRTKTAYLCTVCKKPICLTCSKKICQKCVPH